MISEMTKNSLEGEILDTINKFLYDNDEAFKEADSQQQNPAGPRKSFVQKLRPNNLVIG
jgi:hypothetical protein